MSANSRQETRKTKPWSTHNAHTTHTCITQRTHTHTHTHTINARTGLMADDEPQQLAVVNLLANQPITPTDQPTTTTTTTNHTDRRTDRPTNLEVGRKRLVERGWENILVVELVFDPFKKSVDVTAIDRSITHTHACMDARIVRLGNHEQQPICSLPAQQPTQYCACCVAQCMYVHVRYVLQRWYSV